MKKLYKLTFFILFVLFTANVKAVNLPTEASANSSAYCKEECSKRGVLDTGMYEVCMECEYEGYFEDS